MADMEEQPIEAPTVGRRCYVGNLAWKTSWQDLKDAFRECGTVVYANVMQDHNGRSKGWGIVEFETAEEATEACTNMNGVELSGRPIMVREDREDRDIKARGGGAAGGGDGSERPPAPRRERAPGGGRGDRAEGGRGEGGRGGGRGRGRGDSSASTGLQVVVQGIPWAYEGNDLKALFTEYNKDYDITAAEIVYGRDQRSRGYGTVQFASQEQAQMAIADFHDYELEGRTLTVKVDMYA